MPISTQCYLTIVECKKEPLEGYLSGRAGMSCDIMQNDLDNYLHVYNHGRAHQGRVFLLIS